MQTHYIHKTLGSKLPMSFILEKETDTILLPQKLTVFTHIIVMKLTPIQMVLDSLVRYTLRKVSYVEEV